MGELVVSDHAVARFRERTGSGKDDVYVRNRVLELVGKAKPAKFRKPAYATMALLNHDFERADYRIYNDMVFVIVRNCVMTIHKNESKRWMADE